MKNSNENRKSGMFKSHIERLSEAPIVYPTMLVADYDIRSTEQVVVNDRVINKSCVRTIHPQDLFKGFVASDFALENVIAVGALDSLKESKLSVCTTSELSDSLEGTIDNVIEAVNTAEAQSVEPHNSEGE